jgi:hypothetical protein
MHTCASMLRARSRRVGLRSPAARRCHNLPVACPTPRMLPPRLVQAVTCALRMPAACSDVHQLWTSCVLADSQDETGGAVANL